MMASGRVDVLVSHVLPHAVRPGHQGAGLLHGQETAFDRLQEMGVNLKSSKGQTRSLRIGLLNIMPAAVRSKTVEQFFGLIGPNQTDIEPVLIRFDEYLPRTGRDEHLAFYEPFADVCKKGLDGLIVTGANLEITEDGSAILPIDEVVYAAELRRILDWARENVRSTIYSCWAAHFALEHFYGWARTPLGTTTFNNASGTTGQSIKTFGLFDQNVDHSAFSALTLGMSDRISVPQSRWGDTPLNQMPAKAKAELKVLAWSNQSGWHLMAGPNAREVYLQGHPEYYTKDLQGEYDRDKKAGMNPRLPVTYFPNGDDTQNPVCNWRADGHVFYRNWVNVLLSDSAASKQSI